MRMKKNRKVGYITKQEGGEIPALPEEGLEEMAMEVEGEEGEQQLPSQAGLIADPNGVLPQDGGEESVADDIPMTADEGDFILPYETVLLVGLKQLNRYAREAVKLADSSDVDLTGTNIDPTDDVLIKISNYEYRIPKQLVPFFGGGKKYLDKIQAQGLALRKRLEEEGVPELAEEGAEENLGMPPEELPPELPQEAPPELPMEDAGMGGISMEGGAMPPQSAPPPPPSSPPPPTMMPMQKGGFVLSKDEDARILEADESPSTMEQVRLRAQQPAMVTPDGKKVQQGFSAPAGYVNGGEVMQGLGFTERDITPENVGILLQNANDAVNILQGYDAAFKDKFKTDEKSRMELAKKSQQYANGREVKKKDLAHLY